MNITIEFNEESLEKAHQEFNQIYGFIKGSVDKDQSIVFSFPLFTVLLDRINKENYKNYKKNDK